MCDLGMFNIVSDGVTETFIHEHCKSGCHIASIKLEIKSLEAVRLACERLGVEFREGQKTYAWYGGTNKCDHAIHVPDTRYEIGLYQEGDVWKMLWDPYGLTQVFGDDCERLKHAYGIEAGKLEAENMGLSVWEETLEDGSVKLTINVGE